MLTLKIPMTETYHEDTMTFSHTYFTLALEHSLLSLSKWESEYEKPFLDGEPKTDDEVVGYMRAMILTEQYPPDIFDKFTQKNIDEVNAYIDRKMTATWFTEPPGRAKPAAKTGQKITSELVYFWMTSYRIPWEAERWHLNRLFTLIKVFNAQNEKKKPMTPKDAAAQRRALNAQRQQQHGTRG